MLEKKRVLLERLEDTTIVDTLVAFFADTEEIGLPYEAKLIIPEAVWAEMGKPEEITVTIRPGDRLN